MEHVRPPKLVGLVGWAWHSSAGRARNSAQLRHDVNDSTAPFKFQMCQINSNSLTERLQISNKAPDPLHCAVRFSLTRMSTQKKSHLEARSGTEWASPFNIFYRCGFNFKAFHLRNRSWLLLWSGHREIQRARSSVCTKPLSRFKKKKIKKKRVYAARPFRHFLTVNQFEILQVMEEGAAMRSC